jgi:hypothetical protein
MVRVLTSRVMPKPEPEQKTGWRRHLPLRANQREIASWLGWCDRCYARELEARVSPWGGTER